MARTLKRRRGQKKPCEPGPTESLDDAFDTVDADGKYKIVQFGGSGRAEALSDGAAQEFASIKRLDHQSWYLTSGTTGKPKGCVHTQIDLAYAGETYGKNVMGLTDGSVTATDVLMAGPYAMGSNNVFPLLAGGIVFLDHTDKLDTTGLADNFPRIRLARPNIFISIPGTIQKLAEYLNETHDEDLIGAMEQLKVITSAGAPLPPPSYCNFRYAAKKRGLDIEVLDGIGTSELQHIFISNMLGDVRSAEGGIGCVVQGYEARLLHPKTTDDNSVMGELMIRTLLPDIKVRYSSTRQPRGYDLEKATQDACSPPGDDGAPFYITGDVATARKIGGRWYFYLLGRTKDLTSQLSGEARGMGVDDYKRKQVANSIMFQVGLLEHAEKICAALPPKNTGGVGPGEVPFVLTNEVFPVDIKLAGSEEACVYVVSVTPQYWGSAEVVSDALFKPWVDYINSGVEQPWPALYFAPAGKIPRTQPPLLKPKVGDMRKALQKWVDDEKVACLDAATCMRMSCAQCF